MELQVKEFFNDRWLEISDSESLSVMAKIIESNTSEDGLNQTRSFINTINNIFLNSGNVVFKYNFSSGVGVVSLTKTNIDSKAKSLISKDKIGEVLSSVGDKDFVLTRWALKEDVQYFDLQSEVWLDHQSKTSIDVEVSPFWRVKPKEKEVKVYQITWFSTQGDLHTENFTTFREVDDRINHLKEDDFHNFVRIVQQPELITFVVPID